MIVWNDSIVERTEVQIDLEDRGYQFGDGVYEVIRVYNGHCFELEAHLARLERSLTALRIPSENSQLKDRLLQLLDVNQLKNGIIYLQITRGNAPRNHPFPSDSKPVLIAYTKDLDRPLYEIKEGIDGCLIEDFRWLKCYIKSLNLLGNVWAKQEAVERGYKEALFHRDGRMTEGSSSNIFIIKGESLITHPANHLILNGITRMWVLKTAHEAQLSIEERTFSIEELMNADEAFVTSTTQEIMPIIKIEEHIIANGKPGKNTKKLQLLFEEVIQSL